MWMSPRLAVTLVAAAAGTVMTRSERAPSSDGMVSETEEPAVVTAGVSCWALVSASESVRV